MNKSIDYNEKFVTVGIGSYRYGKREVWNVPFVVGLELCQQGLKVCVCMSNIS